MNILVLLHFDLQDLVDGDWFNQLLRNRGPWVQIHLSTARLSVWSCLNFNEYLVSSADATKGG